MLPPFLSFFLSQCFSVFLKFLFLCFSLSFFFFLFLLIFVSLSLFLSLIHFLSFIFFFECVFITLLLSCTTSTNHLYLSLSLSHSPWSCTWPCEYFSNDKLTKFGYKANMGGQSICQLYKITDREERQRQLVIGVLRLNAQTREEAN